MSREARIVIGLLLLCLAGVFWFAPHHRSVITCGIAAALAAIGVACLIPRKTSEPDVVLQPLATVVGDPDKFIADVVVHVARFQQWAATKKGLPPKDESRYLEWLWRHAEELEKEENSELLVAAIAAYGDFVREKTGRVWRKSRWLADGEPVIVKPGRQWTRRRPVLEVIDALDVVM